MGKALKHAGWMSEFEDDISFVWLIISGYLEALFPFYEPVKKYHIHTAAAQQLLYSSLIDMRPVAGLTPRAGRCLAPLSGTLVASTQKLYCIWLPMHGASNSNLCFLG